MKKGILISIILLSATINTIAQNEKEIKADIKGVTVFPDRAQISREATVSLLTGVTTLKLPGLSPYIDLQSIQVKGIGEFTILSVKHQNNYLQNLEETPEVKSVRNQIENLKIKIEDEKAAINVLKEKEAFLIANRSILVKETTFSIEQLRSLMDLYTRNIEEVTINTLKKNRLIKEWEKQITTLQNQLAEKLGKQQLPSGEISILVSTDKQVSGKLKISYVVSNASWYPSYDIRVDDLKNPVALLYKANLSQSTGVEWKNVNLSFSNASPWISGNIPQLYPWFIDFYNPAPIIQRSKMALAYSRAEAPVMMDLSANEVKSEIRDVEAVPVAVQKKVGETTVTFDLAVPYTIPSNGETQTVEIQRLSAAADYKYVTTPKLSQLAYLTARITDWASLSLQSGETTLYFENSFVGKSYLNINQLTDTLTISLGTDNSILVKREKRKDFTSRRVIGANKTETYSFLVTIRNNKSTPVSITLKDQIPISSNNGITIEPVELSGGAHNPLTGEIAWELTVKPQESKQIILTYSAKYPKDKTIILE